MIYAAMFTLGIFMGACISPRHRVRAAFAAILGIAIAQGACSSTQKQDAALATMATFQAAEIAYTTWDAEHQLSIETNASDAATYKAQITAYRASQAKVIADSKTAADALKAWLSALNDATFSAWTTAAATFYADLKALGVPL